MESRQKQNGIQEVKFVPSGGNSTAFKESERKMHKDNILFHIKQSQSCSVALTSDDTSITFE